MLSPLSAASIGSAAAIGALTLEVRLFRGQGSRVNRVHVFDRYTGCFVTSGYTRGSVLFVRRPIDAAAVLIREFLGRPRSPRPPLRAK
ncbi:MAG: hypothetical protein QM736_09390 [Vicinamibacterales bacterium]